MMNMRSLIHLCSSGYYRSGPALEGTACGRGAIKKNQNIFNYGANTFSKNSNIVPNDIFSAENLEILSSFEICWNMMKQGNGVSVENVSPTQKPLRRRRPPSLGCVVLSYILLFSSLLALNVYISQQWSEWKKEQCRSGCIQVRDNVLYHEWKIWS